MSQIPPADIYEVIKIVGQNWKLFARTKLNLEPTEIENCEYMERDLTEIRYQMVETWMRKEGQRATAARLYQMAGYQSPAIQPPQSQDCYQKHTENSAASNMQISSMTSPQGDAPNRKEILNTGTRKLDKSKNSSPMSHSQENNNSRGASGVSKDIAPVNKAFGENSPEKQRKNSRNGDNQGQCSSSKPITKPKKTGIIKRFTNKVFGNGNKSKAGQKSSPSAQSGHNMTSHLCDSVEWGKVDLVDDEDINKILQNTNHYLTENIRGCVLILNNSFMNDKEQKREGADKDVSNMEKLWSQIGCDIYGGVAQQDKTAEEMRLLFKQMTVLKMEYSYIVIVIMTHGEFVDRSVVIKGSDNQDVSVNEIETIFNNKNAPQLINIPKFFIFQFCCGTKLDLGVQTDYKSIRKAFERMESVDELAKYDRPIVRADGGKVPTSSDMHFAYATHMGHVAIRSPTNGSWFITAITNVFKEYSRSEDLHLLLLRVHDAMKSKRGMYEDENKDIYDVGAMSWSGGSLTKRLFLLPGYHKR